MNSMRQTETARSQGPMNQAEIRLDHLSHNVQEIRRFCSPDTRLMAVIKGNAYGHGLIPVARHLQLIGFRHFAVSNMEDAISLREQGINGQILHIGEGEYGRVEDVVAWGITPSICSIEYAHWLSEQLCLTGATLAVHLRMDQGLGTVGMPEADFYEQALAIADLPGILIEGLYTQIPSAYQNEKGETEVILQRFTRTAQRLIDQGWQDLILHAASSPMITPFPHAMLNMVRVGILLFGLPCIGSEQMELKPVMSLKSHVVRIRQMKDGERYGYECAVNTSGDRMVATIPIGYGDAHFLFLMRDGHVLIKGVRAVVIGRSTMDHLLVDVTGIPDVSIGDEAVLIGEQLQEKITAAEVANRAGYHEMNAECITMISHGVPRIYLKGGE